MKISVTHEFAGWADYWGGNGRRWDDNAGCLFAYYGPNTTLKDCVDQWVDEFFNGGDCDSFPSEVTLEDIRDAILNDFLNDRGRADYECGALAECVEDHCWDDFDDEMESPVWIILVEVEVCPDCGAPTGDDTVDNLCQECFENNYLED